MGMPNNATGGNQGTDPSSGFRPVTAPIPSPDTGQVAPYLVPTQLPSQPAPPPPAPPPNFGPQGMGMLASATKAVQPTVDPSQFAVQQPAPAQHVATPVAHPTIRGAISQAIAGVRPVTATPAAVVPPPAAGGGGDDGTTSGGGTASTGADPAAVAQRVRSYGGGGSGGRNSRPK